MARLPGPQDVSLEGLEYVVRFRDPASFATVASPTWARATAAAVLDDVAADDVTVRVGRTEPGAGDADGAADGSGPDRGLVVSVVLPAEGGKATARERAERVLEAIEG